MLLISAILAFVLHVIVFKVWCFWCRSKVSLVGKTAIITGGASGMGFQTAAALASKGCRVIVADIANLDQSVKELKRLTHNTNIIGKKIQLQSFQSVRSFAKDIIETEPKLHILVCNAGIGDYRKKVITDDGLERTMQINYFSHFLLTHLLLDLLKTSAPSRICFTSSQAAYFSDLTIDKLNPSASYFNRCFIKINGGVYSNSKLALAAATRTFAEKLQGARVTVNAVHPGFVKTDFVLKAAKNDRNILALIFSYTVLCFVGKTIEEGAQSLIHIAHSDEVEAVTGQSFVEGRTFRRPPQLTDEFCQQLWEASIKYTRMAPEEVKC